MNHSPPPHARAAAFDDLLGRISGELAMTEIADSHSGIPFLDDEAELLSETSTASRVEARPSSPVGLAPARGWAAAALAAVMTFGGFVFGAASQSESELEAMNLVEARAEHEFHTESEALLESMRTPGAVQIPTADPQPPVTSAAPNDAPKAEAETPAEPVAKRKSPRRRSSKSPAKSKPSVSFDDL